LAASDFLYDSSLGYADRVGFRCGTCFEYPAFDPILCKKLNIRIRPLVAMEVSVFDYNHAKFFTEDEQLDIFVSLGKICKKFNGYYTLLWHNNNLSNSHKKIYKNILEELL
jgi:hypothetical protein